MAFSKWDHRMIDLSQLVSSWSKDPSTQVGAAIVDAKNRVVALGFNGLPRTVVDDAEIREALQEPIGTIVNAIKVALENTPPELAGDIIDRGIVLTGGGSLLKGMDTRFREETNLPIITVDDPLTSVVLGVGKILDELDLLRKVSVMSQCSSLR